MKMINKMKRLNYLPFQIVLSILAIVILMCFAGCAAYKEKICMNCATKTQVRDSIVYKTTITPYDTLAFIKRHMGPKSTYVNCDSLMRILAANNNTITTVQDGVKSVITKTDKGFTFHCETDSLKEIISLLRIQKDVQSFHKERVEVPTCYKAHLTDNDIFWIKVGKWLFWILIAYIFLRLLKLYLQKSFPMISKFIP